MRSHGRKKSFITPGLFLIGVMLSIASVKSARAIEVSLVNMTNTEDKTAPTIKTFDYQDTLYIFFMVTDYQVNEENRPDLVQNLNVINQKNGKTVFSYPAIVHFTEVVEDPARTPIDFQNYLVLEKLKDRIPPGEYMAVITVEDRIAGEVDTLRARFIVGLGDALKKGAEGSRQKTFRFGKIFFSRSAKGEPLDPPVFRRGELIYVIAEIHNYGMNQEGNARVRENLYLFSPSGDMVIKEEPIVVFDSKGKAGVPIVFTNRITLRNPSPGTYTVRLTAEDDISGERAKREATFQIVSDNR